MDRIARIDGKLFCDVCGEHVELSKYRMHLRYAHKRQPKPKKEWTCEICQKTFTSNYNLQYHLAHHYNLKNFICDQCPNAYNTQSDLNQHKRTHDKGKYNYHCQECGEFFDVQSKFNAHMKSHQKVKDKLECKICKRVLSTQNNLNEHMETHSIERKKLKCQECDKEFSKKKSLQIHVDVIHRGLKKYPCIVCGKAFGNPNDRRKHEHIHEKGRNATYCTYCKKYFENIKLHDDTVHQNFIYTCEFCERKFQSEQDINRHKLLKHMKGNYICDLCGNGFRDLYHLRCHIQGHIVQTSEDIKSIKEGNLKVLDCSICGKHFNYPRSVIRHILSVHEKVKDFECESCGRKFGDKGDLNKHKKRFHAEREDGKYCKLCKVNVKDVKKHFEEVHEDLQFNCDICHTRYKSISTLNYHKKLKHSKAEDVLRFSCSTCDKGFLYKSQLLKHQETHTAQEYEKKTVKKQGSESETEEFKQEPMDHVQAIINYVDYENIKQEPMEEDYQETVSAFDLSSIKHEASDNEHIQKEEEQNNYDDDWSQSRNDTSSSEGDKKLIDFKIETELRKKIKPNDLDGAFKKIVAKYPQEKDGKRLQVRCRMCCDVFKTILDYKDHFMENHAHEDENNHCKMCDLTFMDRKAFLEHFRSVHEHYNCPKCKRQFASQHQLNEHTKKDHDEPDSKLMCNICGKLFATPISLNLHIDAVHNESRYKCDMCECSYSFKSALYKHRQVAHIKGKTHNCDQCLYVAGSKHEVRLHVKNHHTLNRENTRNDVMCGECGMRFHNESTRKRHHFRMHGGLLLRYKHKCIFCSEPQLSSYKADRHMSQVHLSGKKPLRQCGYCKVEIKLFDDYKQHITSSHPGVFICLICGEPHFTPELLSAHQKTHSIMSKDLRRFDCDYCGHRTFNKAQMVVHMTRHATAPELHTCEVCGKSFKIASSLYTHRLYHNGGTIPCSMCDKKFVRNADLKNHIRKEHTLEKPFKCTVCSHSFHFNQALKNHLQTHPQTMQIFSCDSCNISFGNKKKDLENHDEIYHPEKRPFRCFICNLSFTHQHNLERHNRSKHLKI